MISQSKFDIRLELAKDLEYFEKGLSINVVDHRSRNLLLWYIENSSEHQTNIMKLILRSGINVNHIDNSGRNALHYAVEFQSPQKTIQLLMAKGASSSHADNMGMNPLMVLMRQ